MDLEMVSAISWCLEVVKDCRLRHGSYMLVVGSWVPVSLLAIVQVLSCDILTSRKGFCDGEGDGAGDVAGRGFASTSSTSLLYG
jgi:hypothetical protein